MIHTLLYDYYTLTTVLLVMIAVYIPQPGDRKSSLCVCSLKHRLTSVFLTDFTSFYHKRREKYSIFHDRRDFPKPCCAAGGLQRPRYIPTAHDANFSKIHREIHLHIFRWYLYLLLLNRRSWMSFTSSIRHSESPVIISEHSESWSIFEENGLPGPSDRWPGTSCRLR